MFIRVVGYQKREIVALRSPFKCWPGRDAHASVDEDRLIGSEVTGRSGFQEAEGMRDTGEVKPTGWIAYVSSPRKPDPVMICPAPVRHSRAGESPARGFRAQDWSLSWVPFFAGEGEQVRRTPGTFSASRSFSPAEKSAKRILQASPAKSRWENANSSKMRSHPPLSG